LLSYLLVELRSPLTTSSESQIAPLTIDYFSDIDPSTQKEIEESNAITESEDEMENGESELNDYALLDEEVVCRLLGLTLMDD
jgi:hypothetical protein